MCKQPVFCTSRYIYCCTFRQISSSLMLGYSGCSTRNKACSQGDRILRILTSLVQIYNDSISPVQKLCYGISRDELLSKSIYRHGIVSLVYTSIYSYIPGYTGIYIYIPEYTCFIRVYNRICSYISK